MLYHLGTLWRLNELGELPKLRTISSVSGGSITAAVLGIHWNELKFDSQGRATNFESIVVEPIRRQAYRRLDSPSIIWGLLTPRRPSGMLVSAYRRNLYGNKTLQHFPDYPQFILNATNLQTGVNWKFSKSSMGDMRTGYVPSPDLDVAVAVAASSAFPPFLSPLVLDLKESDFEDNRYFAGVKLRDKLPDKRYYTQVSLSDGGISDNLGLENLALSHARIFVSDASGISIPQPKVSGIWFIQIERVIDLIHDQPGSFRKRNLIDSFGAAARVGSFWAIRSKLSDYHVPLIAGVPNRADWLASIPTRLTPLDKTTQEQLINWGYVTADIAIRTHVTPSAPIPQRLPYPDAGWLDKRP